MTLPPLNKPIAHNGSPECPVHPSTFIIIETVKGYQSLVVKAGDVTKWHRVTTYTIIARAPADRIAELEAALKRQDDVIDWIHDTLVEINPGNYDHDDVCRLNDASVEVILAIDDQVEARATLKGTSQ